MNETTYENSRGLISCSRYAFGPNRLHYCGPDANSELAAYMDAGETDFGLAQILKGFQTLAPYLGLIARANHIADPFDPKVVEAYWIGNRLLGRVGKKMIYENFRETQKLRDHIGVTQFEGLTDKVRKGALPHHSFHVFNIWKRTGHMARPHTLESMDSCRVSWGTIVKTDGPFLEIKSAPLTEHGGRLALETPIVRKIARNLDAPQDILDAKIGDIVTVHWGVPCEVISAAQARQLQHYTQMSIAFANLEP